MELVGFGDWLRQSRANRHWSPARVADQVGLPRSTLLAFLSPIRHLQRPSRRVALRIAAAFDMPILAMMVVAGYANRTTMGMAEDAIWAAVMPRCTDLNLSERSALWSLNGWHYLVQVARDAGLSSTVVMERWMQRSGATQEFTAKDWDADTALTRVPRLAGDNTIDLAPGPALGLLVDAAGGDAADIVGLSMAMGRIGPQLAAEWTMQEDYRAWVDVVKAQGWGAADHFDPRAYRQAIHDIRWTVHRISDYEPTPTRRVQSISQPRNELSYDTEDWSYLLGQLPKLSPAERGIIRLLIESWIPRKR